MEREGSDLRDAEEKASYNVGGKGIQPKSEGSRRGSCPEGNRATKIKHRFRRCYDRNTREK